MWRWCTLETEEGRKGISTSENWCRKREKYTPLKRRTNADHTIPSVSVFAYGMDIWIVYGKYMDLGIVVLSVISLRLLAGPLLGSTEHPWLE